MVHAIGVAAKAKGMTDIAEKTGLNRQSQYCAFSEKGEPSAGYGNQGSGRFWCGPVGQAPSA
ncbi:DNA-binding protein [Alloalcanivorax xenomutans]|uniref:helix-turn-helix domain-containing transcriptional regulator n=1 Tax=Alloalcanivorax xenomutans TaxID=1094342 RepID=UPI003BA98BB3